MKKFTSMALAVALFAAECAVPLNVKAETQEMENAVVEQSEVTAEETKAGTREAITNGGELPIGQTVTGSVQDERKRCKFVLPSSGKLNLHFETTSKTLYLEILDKTQKDRIWSTWVEKDPVTGENIYDLALDLTAGTYYFEISTQYGENGSYSISTNLTPSNESFPETDGGSDNSIPDANEAAFDKLYKGQMARNDGEDYYHFYLPSSGAVNFKVNSKIEEMNFELYDKDGERVWGTPFGYGWNDKTQKLTFDQVLHLTQGDYYFEVGKRFSYEGNYDLKASFKSAEESFTETGFGENNEIATASRIVLGKTYKGQLAENDRYDYYSFSKTDSKPLYVNADSGMEAIDCKIYDNNGKEVWGKFKGADSQTKRATLKEKVELPAGTYTIRFERWLDDRTGNYTFSVGAPALTGWQQRDGKWYYYNSTGAASVGWHSIGGKWYYFDTKGVMKTGWQKVGGKWYYLNSSGAMAKGWKQLNGTWYYLDGSGVMKTGWQKISGKWYYFNGSGYMKTGWQKLSGKWYYMNGSGVMVTGTLKINGKVYRFSGTGVCLNP